MLVTFSHTRKQKWVFFSEHSVCTQFSAIVYQICVANQIHVVSIIIMQYLLIIKFCACVNSRTAVIALQLLLNGFSSFYLPLSIFLF